MFELNGTFVIFIGLFFIFMFLLNKIMLQPTGLVIAQRKARAQEDYEQARRSSGEVETIIVHYQQHMEEIRSQAQKVIHDSVASAQSKREQELKRIHAEGKSRVTQMKEELSEERHSLLKSMIEPELDLVKEITAKLLAEPPAISISKQTVQRALEEAR